MLGRKGYQGAMTVDHKEGKLSLSVKVDQTSKESIKSTKALSGQWLDVLACWCIFVEFQLLLPRFTHLRLFFFLLTQAVSGLTPRLPSSWPCGSRSRAPSGHWTSLMCLW
jgi:hypothetical protein